MVRIHSVLLRGWAGRIRNIFHQQVRKCPSIRPRAQEPKFRNKSSSFSLLSSTSIDFPAGSFFFHSLCALGSHMEASITYHKSPRQIPVYLKKAARKKGTETYIPESKSWLYFTTEVVFSELFNFFEPHHLLQSYGNIKILIDNHCCIN